MHKLVNFIVVLLCAWFVVHCYRTCLLLSLVDLCLDYAIVYTVYSEAYNSRRWCDCSDRPMVVNLCCNVLLMLIRAWNGGCQRKMRRLQPQDNDWSWLKNGRWWRWTAWPSLFRYFVRWISLCDYCYCCCHLQQKHSHCMYSSVCAMETSFLAPLLLLAGSRAYNARDWWMDGWMDGWCQTFFKSLPTPTLT